MQPLGILFLGQCKDTKSEAFISIRVDLARFRVKSEASPYSCNKIRHVEIITFEACKNISVSSANPRPTMHLSLIWRPIIEPFTDIASSIQNRG